MREAVDALVKEIETIESVFESQMDNLEEKIQDAISFVLVQLQCNFNQAAFPSNGRLSAQQLAQPPGRRTQLTREVEPKIMNTYLARLKSPHSRLSISKISYEDIKLSELLFAPFPQQRARAI